MHAKLLHSCLWTGGCQLPLSIGFSRREYWSGLPCPHPGDLPNPATEPESPAVTGRFFPSGVQPQQSPGISSGWTTSANEERDRDKERTTQGAQASSVSEARFTLFSSGLLYPELYIQQCEKCRVNIPSVITFINIRFLLVRVLFFVHHLLFWRLGDISWPLFDKCWSARTIIFP